LGLGYYGGYGAIITLLLLFLPRSYYNDYWNQLILNIVPLRVLLLGGSLGLAWGVLFHRSNTVGGRFLFLLFGIFLWSLGENFHPAIPLCLIILGLAVGLSGAGDQFNAIKLMRVYAGRSDIEGDERKKIIETLINAILCSRLDLSRAIAASSLKSFDDGLELLIGFLENASPKIRLRTAYALAIAQPAFALQALEERAAKETDSRVKEAVLDAAQKIRQVQDSVDSI
jgi:hypothetical protein